MQVIKDFAQKAKAGLKLDLKSLAPEERHLAQEILGLGPGFGQMPGLSFQETAALGFWLVKTPDAEYLEIGPLPQLVMNFAASGEDDLIIPSPPEGVMNAPPVLAEVRACLKSKTRHVIDLSSLPMNKADLEYIAAALGSKDLEAQSGGYGAVRVSACGPARLWRVKYLNAKGAVTLDCLEISAAPPAIAADIEDIAESAQRLQEIAEAYL